MIYSSVFFEIFFRAATCIAVIVTSSEPMFLSSRRTRPSSTTAASNWMYLDLSRRSGMPSASFDCCDRMSTSATDDPVLKRSKTMAGDVAPAYPRSARATKDAIDGNASTKAAAAAEYSTSVTGSVVVTKSRKEVTTGLAVE